MSFDVNCIRGCREKPVSKMKSNLNRGNSRKRTPGNACHPEAQTDMTIQFPKAFSGRKTLCLVRPEQTPSFDDVIAHVRADAKLTSGRHRDLVSALNRIAKACDLPPSQMLADPEWVRLKVSKLSPVRLGRRAKTRANVLSNAVAALAYAETGAGRRPQVQRSSAWEALWPHLTASEKIVFGSFMKFCSFHEIPPTQVTDQVVADFRELIVLSSLRKRPEEAIRDLTMNWNRAVGRISGWPGQRLAVLERRVLIAPRIEALPASFQQDLKAYATRMNGGSLLDLEAPKALSEKTRSHRVGQVRRFFGELIGSGVSPEDLPNLRAMVQPDMAFRGLNAILNRKDGQSSGMVHNVAYTLLAIAKHHARLPDQDLDRLRDYCRRLKVPRAGMTEKNRKRLRQFDDPDNLARLLLLPDELLREARAKGTYPRRAAELVEVALAIELLLMTALRIKNLATLHLDEHVSWTRSARQGVCHITIDGREVKNGKTLEFELNGSTANLLASYLSQYRARLVPPTCRWLFARRDGKGPVNPGALSTRIKRTILKRTGLTVNAHLFRALDGMIYLNRNPGGYEVVRQTLGHKHMSTTTSAYTGMESVSAAKLFDRTIKAQQELARSKRGRGMARSGPA
jgi:integrase